MASSSRSELSLSLQYFHQCASLISLKLTSENYFIWSSQVQSLVYSLCLEHQLADVEPPSKTIKEDGKENINPDLIV